ncbi:unnamed protein product [Pylaiella littoralis]
MEPLHDADWSPGTHVYGRRGSRSSSSGSSGSGGSAMARRRCRPRRSPFVTAVTLGAVIVGAAAGSSSGSRNPPPPPPPPPSLGNHHNNNNGRQQQQQQQQQQQDRWTGWTPPPPGPPLDPSVGSSGQSAEAAWGSGTSSQTARAGQDDGTVREDGGSSVGLDTGAVSGMGMMGHNQQQQQQQQYQGVVGGARETQQQAHQRMMMARQQQQGREGVPPPLTNSRQQQQQQQQQQQPPQQQQQQYPQQLQQHPQAPPPSWAGQSTENGAQQQQQEQQHEQFNDGVWNNVAGIKGNQGHISRTRPPLPQTTNGGGLFQQPEAGPAAGKGMAGGAGASASLGGGGAPGADSGGRWEPPSAASAGAVTPEVKLSQYRAAAGGEAGGDKEQEQIARALLSNTDKEIIFDGLKKLYRKKILPLEESSRYAHFHSPPMNPADFEAKPMVLIVGQYSVGKTSFIRSLLKRDFPGQRVGPEPTTDRFVAVTHGEDERVMPGHALAMQADKPFRSLQQFGNNFLTKFEGSVVDAPILRNITLVDTPGVLSGEKQRIGRDYDFASVISWFAERADLIVVMFDAHKLDISDELKMVIDTLKPHHDKMRVLLNKADTIDTQQLMRVYGALMWSLGKVMQTPEVCRVYIGSFWEAPLSNFENRFLLEKEKNDLLEELMLLPENAVVRRINELVKRARSVKVHAYIIHYLRKQMPYMMGKQEKQEKLIRRLDEEFLACARRYGLPLGDFPKVEKFRRSLREIKDISKFKSLDKSLVHEMDKVFSGDIPKLMEKAARPGNR